MRNHDFLFFILQLALHYCNLIQKPNWRIYGYLWNLTFRLLKLKTGIKHKWEVVIPTNSSFAKKCSIRYHHCWHCRAERCGSNKCTQKINQKQQQPPPPSPQNAVNLWLKKQVTRCESDFFCICKIEESQYHHHHLQHYKWDRDQTNAREPQ